MKMKIRKTAGLSKGGKALYQPLCSKGSRKVMLFVKVRCWCRLEEMAETERRCHTNEQGPCKAGA
jgi:hypothetical protein